MISYLSTSFLVGKYPNIGGELELKKVVGQDPQARYCGHMATMSNVALAGLPYSFGRVSLHVVHFSCHKNYKISEMSSLLIAILCSILEPSCYSTSRMRNEVLIQFTKVIRRPGEISSKEKEGSSYLYQGQKITAAKEEGLRVQK